MLTMKANLVVAPVQIKGIGVNITGTDANDIFSGTAFADQIRGGGGFDSISGGGGDDLLFGDAGNDTLSGGTGNDTLDGGTGDDILIGGAGADMLFGGTGFDIASYQTAALGVTINVATGGVTNDAAGDRYSGIERFIGSNFSDIMNGDATNNDFQAGGGDDWLFGYAGDDQLDGGSGDDIIRGGDGADTIRGGSGIDTLTGNAGADVFVFRPGNGADLITDFQTGIDKIGISGFGSKPFGNDGKLAFGDFVDWQNGTVNRNTDFFNLDSSDKLLYDYNTQQLYSINPLFINGEIANFNAELVATIHYDPATFVQVSMSDFMVV
jgi:Ca2+-binding RTX toxin-like protein